MTESKGNILGKLPPIDRSDRARSDWDDKALLAQEHPGQVVLAAEHIARTQYESVKTYRRPPYRTGEGHIRINIRNSKVEDDGKRYGDMFFTWIPREETDGTAND